MMNDCLNSDALAVLDEMAQALALDGQPTDDAVWIGLYRAQLHEFRRFAGAAAPMRRVREVVLGRNGHQMKVREYTPMRVGNAAGLLYLHGGGFIGGSLDTHDRLARALAAACGSKVFALDYPLAPERAFPAAAETCFAAFRGLAEEASHLKLDASKLVVIGDSVGGLFTAVVAILCRDRHVSPPALQISLYPNMDLRVGRDYPSMHRHDGTVVKLIELERGLKHYLVNPADRDDPRASPLACPDVHGLAPAWVLTCECDPLRDEGRKWAERLKAAGNAVTHVEAEGLPHAFLQMGGRIPAAQSILTKIGAAVGYLDA